ncbi:MAG: UDP-N-acetylglucosamine--N-acetylmuramyl-(pentapeptide) pyrophosphoryl-undecaprenol N-acetylglucosamine transferase, partial [Gammaproteobacteria bacterium]|nr:UDP-N-acetylglucosamine--N-acetylmuramyl-(pentapeptide) pyrophosphoryl-undecaprenol N-acetylglucosamine transferase [Gammaproteobacteria bacterium]
RLLNRVVPAAVAELYESSVPEIWHQSGRGNAAPVEAAYRTAGVDARVTEFIEDMASAYEWTDLVVCRAGAMTVAEVSAAGVAALFVPFAQAVGDHQAANAQYLVERGAALMLREHELTAERLCATLEELRTDRRRIEHISHCARQLGRPNATSRVADICMEVLSA